MQVSLDTLQSVDLEAWNQRLLTVPESSLWQAVQWGKYSKFFLSVTPKFLTVHGKDGMVFAQLMFFQQAAHHWFFADRPAQFLFQKVAKLCPQELYWVDGPIVFDKTRVGMIIREILKFLEDYSNRQGIIAHRGVRLPVYWDNSTAIAEANKVFREWGYEGKEWGTFVLDLSPDIEKLWSNLKGNVRTSIRKFEKQKLQIQKNSSDRSLLEFQKIREEDRQRLNARTFSVKSRILQRNYLQGFKSDWQLYFATHNDKMLGGINTFTFNNKTIHGNLSRSCFCRNKKFEVFYGLIWKIIQESKQLGYSKYDLAGVNPKPVTSQEIGIYDFKKKWGGNLVRYMEYTKILRPDKERAVRFFHRNLKRLGVK